MNFKKLVESRRSIKYFDPSHQMQKDEINALMKLALMSPTAFNIQHWRFTIVQNTELREKIRQIGAVKFFRQIETN